MKIYTKTLEKPIEFYLSKLETYPLIMKEKFANGKRRYAFILKKTEKDLDDYARYTRTNRTRGERIYFVSMYLQKNKSNNAVYIEIKVWYMLIFPIIFIFFLFNTIRFLLIMDRITFLEIIILTGFCLTTILFGFFSLKIIKLSNQCYKKIKRLKAIIDTLK